MTDLQDIYNKYHKHKYEDKDEAPPLVAISRQKTLRGNNTDDVCIDIDRLTDNYYIDDNQEVDLYSNQYNDRSVNQYNDRSVNQYNDRSVNQYNDRSVNQYNDRSVNQYANQYSDKYTEILTKQYINQYTNLLANRQVNTNQYNDKYTNLLANRQVNTNQYNNLYQYNNLLTNQQQYQYPYVNKPLVIGKQINDTNKNIDEGINLFTDKHFDQYIELTCSDTCRLLNVDQSESKCKDKLEVKINKYNIEYFANKYVKDQLYEGYMNNLYCCAKETIITTHIDPVNDIYGSSSKVNEYKSYVIYIKIYKESYNRLLVSSHTFTLPFDKIINYTDTHKYRKNCNQLQLYNICIEAINDLPNPIGKYLYTIIKARNSRSTDMRIGGVA